MERNGFIKYERLTLVLTGAFVSVTLFGLFACGYPVIRQSSIKPDDVLDFVDKHYDNFSITYCGGKDSPTAILFDPKDKDVLLTGDGWYPVENKAQANDMIREIIARYRFYNGVYSGPYLFEVAAKDGTLLGYYYSIFDSPVVRQDGNHYSVSPISEMDIREARRGYSVKGAGG